MTTRRLLPASLTAVALLATPGCTGWVIVEERGPLVGLFVVSQAPPSQASAAAVFTRSAEVGYTELDHDGQCVLQHHDLPSADHEPWTELDAGRLRVTGGLEELAVEFADGYHFPQKTKVFEAGDMLEFDVEGGYRIPALSATIPAPPTPVVSFAPEVIDTGEDHVFTWTSPPGTGMMTIQVQGDWPDTGSGSHPRDVVACRTDLSQGTLTMPASLLSQVSNDNPHGAHVTAYAGTYERHDVDDGFVGFTVWAVAATPSGGAYFLHADLKK